MRKLWKPLLLLATIAIMGFGMLNTGAWFTDTETSQLANLNAGTLSIDGPGMVSQNLGEIDDVYPGWVSDPVVITIKNDGSLPLAWFGNFTATGSMLKNAIYIYSAKMEFFDSDGEEWETADTFITKGVGSGLHPSWYNTLASQSRYGVITLDVWDGNNGMGSAPYEHIGALLPGNYYKLTLQFAMAEEAGNEYQGTGTLDLGFTVQATQITQGALNAIGQGNHLSWMNAQITKQTQP